MTKLSVPMKNSVRGPRATAPVHFAKFSVFRWWFVALVLGVIVDTVQAKDYFSNPVRRSCVCGNYKSNTDYFEHKVFPDDAKFWDVKYEKSYKILTDKQHNRRTFLYLCGTPVPGSAEGVKSGDQVVEIPIKRASVDSSTMFPYFEYIGQRTSITHGSTYATSPCMQKHVRNGNVDDGPLEDSDVDFAFVGKYSWDTNAKGDASYYNKPVFVLDAANEAKALGQLEYTKLVSLFFNREEAAKDINTYVEKRMICHKKAVKNKKKMKVAIVSLLQISGNTNCNKFTQNTMVSVRKCPHPNCDVLKATNAKLLTKFPKGSFSLKTFVKKARKADVLIIQANLANPGFYDPSNNWAYTPITGECLDQFNKAIKSTKAGKNGDVYDIYKTKSEAGATAFFEGLNAEPDVAMLDLLSALRPGNYGDHERVFYRKAWGDDAEPVTVLSHTDCDDVDDPLYNAWTKKACKSETPNVVVRGLGKVRNSDVC